MAPLPTLRAALHAHPLTALPAAQLARAQDLDLAWAEPATLRLLATVGALPGAKPRRHLRQTCCLAGVAARLWPRCPPLGAAVAALHGGMAALVAAHAPASLAQAQAAAADGAATVAAGLAAEGLETDALMRELAEWWQAPQALRDALAEAGSPLHGIMPAAGWLLHLRRMATPLAVGASAPDAAALAALGLGPAGLVTAISALSVAVEDGRRLAQVLGEPPAAG